MTLISTIITDAYREGNLIAVATTPTANELAEGLTLLNRYIASVYGNEAGEELGSVVIGNSGITRPQGYPGYNQVPDEADWTVPDNSRLFLNLSSAQTVYLNPNPRDGARFAFIDKAGTLDTANLTVNGNGRTIGGSATLVVSTEYAAQEYFYRADTGNWALVSPLEDDDDFPFPTEFEDMFVIGLALRLNPRHGTMINQQSMATYNRLLKAFRARYRQVFEMCVELGLARLPSMHNYYGDDTRDGNLRFNAGRP